MQVFSNFWGGDGYLSCTALLAVAATGILNDMTAADGSGNVILHYRCMDFTTQSDDKSRWENMGRSYQAYAETVFGSGVRGIVRDNIPMSDISTIDDKQTLNAKFKDKGKLALGFTASEMELNIREGIYGKPHVGESFHSDARFDALYTNGADGNDIVINCGGYKGGGTAATFIPMENTENFGGMQRYSVVSGPSTAFEHSITLNNNLIRLLPTGYRNPVDIFEAGEIRDIVREMNEDHITPDVQELIDVLDQADQQIHNSSATNSDYSDLDPKYYMRRFIDRIYSDASIGKAEAIVINMKPDCKSGEKYQYDVTCDKFMADNQKHKIHITNLLNALSIQRIARKDIDTTHGEKIFTFCASPTTTTNKYTISGMLDANDAIKFYAFLAFSALLIKYTYPCFSDLQLTHGQTILTKWAQEKKQLFSWKTFLDESNPIGSLNKNFANTVAAELAKFLCEYVRPVLEVFMEVQATSKTVELFSKNSVGGNEFGKSIFDIVEDMISSCHAGENACEIINHQLSPAASKQAVTEHIKDTVPKTLAALFQEKGNFLGKDFMTTLNQLNAVVGTGNAFLDKYQSGFEEFESRNKDGHRVWSNTVTTENVQQKAKEYCQKIIGYTYRTVLSELM